MKNKGQNQKLFLKNFPLKLLGFVLAVLLWLVLNNTQDPVITSSVSVPITYEEGGLAEKNKVEFYCDHILYFAGILIDDHLVIVTTDANAYVKPVHYRMPVILEKEDIDPWLKDISRTQEILSKPGIALQRKQLQEPLF